MDWSNLLEKSVIIHAPERVNDFETVAERIECRWVVASARSVNRLSAVLIQTFAAGVSGLGSLGRIALGGGHERRPR